MPMFPTFATLCAVLVAPPVTPAPVPAPPASETPDYIRARWEPASPSNFRPSSRPSQTEPVDIIVMHDIEGSAMSAVRWFQNPVAQVSSHYVVGADGAVYQQVKERDVAWHAGNREINARAVGIEQEGFAYRPGFFTPQLYEASARLVRDISTRHGIPRDRTHIIGHFEVPSLKEPGKFGGAGNHTDPGFYYDWDYFMRLVRNDAQITASAKPVASFTLHPGENAAATFAFTNTGDDPWLSDKKDDPAPERRQKGTVFLGTVGDITFASGDTRYRETGIRQQSTLYAGKGWVSPLYVTSAAESDVAPGATGTFTVPIRVPGDVLGVGEQLFRLVTVPVAPGIPAAFGDTVRVAVTVKPWEVGVALPQKLPAGWNTMAQKDGSRLVWRKPGANAAPLKWKVNLPVAGRYAVQVRFARGKDKNQLVTYRVNETEARQFDQRGATTEGAGDWFPLGVFPFAPALLPVATTAPANIFEDGVTLPGVVPAPATVELLGTSGAAGIISAYDEIRFIGPLPQPSED